MLPVTGSEQDEAERCKKADKNVEKQAKQRESLLLPRKEIHTETRAALIKFRFKGSSVSAGGGFLICIETSK